MSNSTTCPHCGLQHNEMLLRAGFYAGLAAKILGDDSYAQKWLGQAETITDEAYWQMVHDVSSRLVAAGMLAPDEDAFETEMKRRKRREREGEPTEGE